MALPYPEGQVFFKRTALRSSYYNFDVENDDKAFYSHFLLENTWNTWAFSNGTTPDLSHIPSHPRSSVLKGRAQNYRTEFGKSDSSMITPLSYEVGLLGVWDSTSVLYSDERSGDNYFHREILDNNQNFNTLRDVDAGGPLRTVLRPVPLVNAKFMLIDWLNPFRAVYFPLAHKAGQGFEDLCVYLMIDFRLRQGVEMRSPGYNTWLKLKFDREKGLNYSHGDVMSFDLKGIYEYLILPQQLRNPEKGLYKTTNPDDALITMWDRNWQRPLSSSNNRRPWRGEIDLVDVINENFGVDVCWQPYEYSSWVVDFLTHVTSLALGFIPVVGPLLSVSFSVGLQVITDPDGFAGENILNLGADVLAALIAGGRDVNKNLPDNFQKSGSKVFLIRGPASEKSEPKAEDEGNRITVTKNEGDEIARPEDEDEGKQTAEKEGDEGEKLGEEREAEDRANPNAEQKIGGEEPVEEQDAEDKGKQSTEEKVAE